MTTTMACSSIGRRGTRSTTSCWRPRRQATIRAAGAASPPASLARCCSARARRRQALRRAPGQFPRAPGRTAQRARRGLCAPSAPSACTSTASRVPAPCSQRAATCTGPSTATCRAPGHARRRGPRDAGAAQAQPRHVRVRLMGQGRSCQLPAPRMCAYALYIRECVIFKVDQNHPREIWTF